MEPIETPEKTKADVTRAERLGAMMFKMTMAATLAIATWYWIAVHNGDLTHANYAMLGLFGMAILWVGVFYERVVMMPCWRRSLKALPNGPTSTS